MKTKDTKETVRAFLPMITENTWPKKIGVDKGRKFLGELKTLWIAEVMQIYSRMGDTKPALAERTIRSVKKILFCCIEEYS